MKSAKTDENRCEECARAIPSRYEGTGLRKEPVSLCGLPCWIDQHQREAGPRFCPWPQGSVAPRRG